jgi:transketolase
MRGEAVKCDLNTITNLGNIRPARQRSLRPDMILERAMCESRGECALDLNPTPMSSQMALADVAFMRAFTHVRDHRGNPALTVLTPSDARSTYALVLAMGAFPSACYVRTVRGDLPILYDEGEQFPLVGHKVLRRADDGTQRIVLAACGYMVHSCLKAADMLSKQHRVEATVVDAYSLPLDSAPILALAGAGSSIITVEDNYVGGLGSELAEAAASAGDQAPQVQSLCVHNIPKSDRTPEDVLAYVHLSVEEIVAAAVKAAR